MVLHAFKGRKCQTSYQGKNWGKSPFSPIFLVSQDLLVWQMHDMIQCTTFKNIFLKNVSNLRHSNEDTIRPKKELFSNNVGGYNSG